MGVFHRRVIASFLMLLDGAAWGWAVFHTSRVVRESDYVFSSVWGATVAWVILGVSTLFAAWWFVDLWSFERGRRRWVLVAYVAACVVVWSSAFALLLMTVVGVE